ncbi:transmembrane protein 209 isoform X1 [Tachypleus tridentatus]|uniref:transmembrane protein 209 isoform X1 n=1 Tax=Tachypleus tridentatus TaxID=6853 RepID=UPI003FD438AE
MSSSRSLVSENADFILARKVAVQRARTSLLWGVISFIIAIILFIDIKLGSVSRYFCEDVPMLWYFEFFLTLMFITNALFSISVNLWQMFGQNCLYVTPSFKKLLAISDQDVGFKTEAPKSTEPLSSSPQTPSPVNSFFLPSLHSSRLSSQSFLSMTPVDYSAASWANSSMMSDGSLSSSSWMFFPGSVEQRSRETSWSKRSSPVLSDSAEKSGLKKRWNTTANTSNLLGQEEISDAKSLDEYLKEYESREQRAHMMRVDTAGGGSYMFYQRSPTDYTHLLRKYQYQPATRSTQSSGSSKDNPDSPTRLSGDGVFSRLKITENQLNVWVENLRKWLTQTILRKLATEIDNINESLRRLGSAELQIGDVSFSTLRQVALTKGQHVPKLATLLPYLDLTVNQDYLVQRIKELAKGGCMSEFKWNKGGSYKGKPWGDYLPTDCNVVMHMFCTYMDSRLPADPHYPDGKTFTSQYFRKTPDKPNVTKSNINIYQSWINPPHYQVVTGEDTWDPPKGWNNIFYAILLFLHHVKVKEASMLGRVNLGLSGINILWVLEN